MRLPVASCAKLNTPDGARLTLSKPRRTPRGSSLQSNGFRAVKGTCPPDIVFEFPYPYQPMGNVSRV